MPPTDLLAALPTVLAESGASDHIERLSDHFHLLDWAVLLGYLVLVSVLGVVLAGKQSDVRDFFRGGDSLPWYAVSGSMIATIVSAVTFVGVPAVIYRDGGNFTYLQFGLIAGLISRLFVALVLVPTYYKYRIYSPYDYMGQQLGASAKAATTALFTVLGVLSQAARVYLTANILELILSEPFELVSAWTGLSTLACAILAVGVIAVIWTMLGGIATVIWTDVMLFLVFVIGGVTALAVAVIGVPGSWGELITTASEAGKFQLWSINASFDATEPYTLWAAIFAVTFSNIGTYGTDQLLAQRIFCCKNVNHAKAAVMGSWLGEAVVALMLLVGAGIWVYYQAFPEAFSDEVQRAVKADEDMIFPAFILTQAPMGLTGLIIAGIFAAAISSLTSILAALSQTTLSAVYLPLKKIDLAEDQPPSVSRKLLKWSRGLIVFWGVVLCVTAYLIAWYVQHMRSIGEGVLFLDLALGLASYITGALLAAFLLAWLPLRVNGFGLLWSAPLSIFSVFALRFHDELAQLALVGPGVVLLLAWGITLAAQPTHRWRWALRTLWLLAGCVLMVLISRYFYFSSDAGEIEPIAWPWYAPIGVAIAFTFGYVLAEPRNDGKPAGSDSPDPT